VFISLGLPTGGEKLPSGGEKKARKMPRSSIPGRFSPKEDARFGQLLLLVSRKKKQKKKSTLKEKIKITRKIFLPLKTRSLLFYFLFFFKKQKFLLFFFLIFLFL